MALFILAATDSPIKQADTIMLTYPLNWNVSGDIMKNDLEMYETVTNDRSPAMTWSWFTIGWKWVNDKNKMNSYFLKSYQDYLIQPFKVSCSIVAKSFPSHNNFCCTLKASLVSSRGGGGSSHREGTSVLGERVLDFKKILFI